MFAPFVIRQVNCKKYDTGLPQSEKLIMLPFSFPKVCNKKQYFYLLKPEAVFYLKINFMKDLSTTAFVPQLIIAHGTRNLDFYKHAFGAVETKHIVNADGSIHVSEMYIDGAMFHFHEENYDNSTFSPAKYNGVTTITGLMVADADAVITRALNAGAILVSPAQSYDYGYRQGSITDPLGHQWLIEMVI
jgi:PhnB protein